MKSTISLPVVECLEVNNYALYPGASGKGLKLTFNAGVTVLAGINGVGKTTILNLLLRMILGPYDPKKLDQGLSRVSDRDLVHLKPFDYFQKRVSDPLGPDTTATLDFTLDSKNITVTRLLGSMELKEVLIDGQPARFDDEVKYQEQLAKMSGLSSSYDFHIVVRHLQFFMEERLPILWSAGAQFEFFKILFFEFGVAKQLDDVFAKVQSIDSDYRNRRHQLTKRKEAVPPPVIRPAEDELRALDGMILEAKTAYEEAQTHQAKEKEEFSSLQSASRELDIKIEDADAALAVLENEFHQSDAAYIAQALPGLDNKLKFLMQGLTSGLRCFVCGDQDSKHVTEIGQTLRGGHCFVCHAPVGVKKGGMVEPISSREIERLELKIDDVRRQMSRWAQEKDHNSQTYAVVAAALQAATTKRSAARQSLESLQAQRPGEARPVNDLQAEFDREEAELQLLDAERKRLADKYREGIAQGTKVVDGVREEIRVAFAGYAQAFLQEKVEVQFRKDATVSLATGAGKVSVPTFLISMTSSTHKVTQQRLTSDSVSESQKEFLDLAFRMTLLDQVCKGGSTLMVIETPEASLDIWFMRKAAILMRQFAPDNSSPKRKLIATSNVNGTIMIPALLGLLNDDGSVTKIAKSRASRLVDLWKLTAEAAILGQDDARLVLQTEWEKFADV